MTAPTPRSTIPLAVPLIRGVSITRVKLLGSSRAMVEFTAFLPHRFPPFLNPLHSHSSPPALASPPVMRFSRANTTGQQFQQDRYACIQQATQIPCRCQPIWGSEGRRCKWTRNGLLRGSPRVCRVAGRATGGHGSPSFRLSCQTVWGEKNGQSYGRGNHKFSRTGSR